MEASESSDLLYGSSEFQAVSNTQGSSCMAYYDLFLEVTEHHVHHPLLLEVGTCLPRVKKRGHRPHFSMVIVSNTLGAMI